MYLVDNGIRLADIWGLEVWEFNVLMKQVNEFVKKKFKVG